VSATIVRAFPSDDPEFRRLVVETVRSLAAREEGASVGEVLEVVRARFPHADIRPQERLAKLGGDVVWYAYRDGSPAAKL
jgi:hypothetical protein